MNDPKKQHKTVLLPETEDSQNVKFGWLWLVLLILGVLMAFWRDASFDPAAQQKIRDERIHKVQEFEKQREKLGAQNAKIDTTKGNLKAGK